MFNKSSVCVIILAGIGLNIVFCVECMFCKYNLCSSICNLCECIALDEYADA